jgi:hypothetical protein
MPVRNINKLEHSTEYAALVDELFAEWQNVHSTNREPVILVEKTRDGKPAHFYVIWTKWSAVERNVRSEIIMDAAEKKFSPDDMQAVTIAMGLTPDEADRFNLKWR